MSSIIVDAWDYVDLHAECKNTEIPSELVITNELGRGSNNRVYEAEWDGVQVCVRVPRRGSDTQSFGSAKWECAQTIKAGQIGIGPSVYSAWIAKHKINRYPAGLYMVTDIYDCNLEEFMTSRGKHVYVIKSTDQIAKSISKCLEKASKERMFLYDLKPSNVMVSVHDEPPQAKLIDFGQDFCEWAETGRQDDRNIVLRYLDSLVNNVDVRDKTALRDHVVFATMMVLLSATTTSFLYHDRRKHELTKVEREKVNGIARLTNQLLDSMQSRSVSLVRKLLRHDEVRGVLKHYHGRKNSGTGNILKLARGIEPQL